MLDDHVIAGVGGDTVDRSHLVALGRRRRRRERPRARRCSAMDGHPRSIAKLRAIRNHHLRLHVDI